MTVAPASPSLRQPTVLASRRRGLIVWAVIAIVLNSISSTASRGECFGGVDADGNLLDAAGRVTRIAPRCVDTTLHGSPVVSLVIVALVIGTLIAASRASVTEDAALRLLDGACILVALIAVGSAAIATTWYFAVPMDQFAHGSVWPFPFGVVDVHEHAMQSG